MIIGKYKKVFEADWKKGDQEQAQKIFEEINSNPAEQNLRDQLIIEEDQGEIKET